MSDGTAKKRDPEKWEGLKTKARKRMVVPGSAVQLATKYYKEAGDVRRQEVQGQQLSKWSKEDWQTKEEYEKKKK